MKKLVQIYALSALASGLLLGHTLPAQARSSSTEQGHASNMSSKMPAIADCPMMAAMLRGPDAALSKRKALGLTDAQVRQLETVRTAEMQAMKPAMDGMMAIHKQLAALSDAPQFDESAVRSMFDRMGALHTAAGTAMLRARHDAAAVLTAEQRKKLDDSAGMTGAMGMTSMSGMAGKGMMKGGMGNMSSMMSMMGMQGCMMMSDGAAAAAMHQ